MTDAILRLAILHVSHWHVPLYLDAMLRPDLRVVAVSDVDPAVRERIAARFGATSYADDADLLDRAAPDFVFAFGEHADMPRIGGLLASRKIPFAMEKPCGLTGDAVAALRDATAKLFVAVPFVFRIGGLPDAIAQIEGGLPASFDHVGFRFMAGPISRYSAAGCDWMLDPARAGGGSGINLALHFIDLFHVLTGQEVQSVSAVMHAGIPGVAVEDHVALLLTGAAGALGTVETSYTYPSVPDDLREFSFSLSSAGAYVRSAPPGLLVRRRSGTASETIALPLNPDFVYADFVTRTLEDFRRGRPPLATLDDAVRAMRVMDAAYASAREGGAAVAV